MKVALLICTYNRPEYLRECLWSLERADLSRVDTIWVVDDCSTNTETISLIKGFKCDHVMTAPTNNGIKKSLINGYESLFFEYEIIINLDSDAIVRPDFVNQLLDNYVGGILTGFHSVTKNANGTDRHKILREEAGLYVKQSVGGINMCINKEAYEKYVKPALFGPGNWDHNACINAGYAYCLKESVIQHIGFDSSMGHIEQPDVADDFYYWHLPNVTLFGVDVNNERLQKAKDICTKWIKFGNAVTLNPNIQSKESYSEFIIKESHKYINASHVLIFQHDGFVNNWKAWDDSWLEYDYIGAPWWYMDGYNVGNGGFSLRSKRLMEIVAKDMVIQSKRQYHPEDDIICRTYRKYLEDNYQIKFAPIEVAEKFSFEGYMQPAKYLSDQFGVHGPNPRKQPVNAIGKKERFVVNQFRGLGDILFLVPLIRELMAEGNTVLWPIVREYFNIAKHFPDINFVIKEDYNFPYDSKLVASTPHGNLLPYRFAMELMGRNMTQCMQSKYELYGHNWQIWRNLHFERFKDKEKELVKLVGAKGKYILVNRYYGEVARGMQITPEIKTDLPIVEMRSIDGFSLIDWCGIIENAAEIHTASTSILYILEMLKLDMPIHFYRRGLWGEQAFEHTQALYTKPYILH